MTTIPMEADIDEWLLQRWPPATPVRVKHVAQPCCWPRALAGLDGPTMPNQLKRRGTVFVPIA